MVNVMNILLSFFPGAKTYLVGIAMVAGGVAAMIVPEKVQVSDPLTMIMTGLGFLGLRKAVAR